MDKEIKLLEEFALNAYKAGEVKSIAEVAEEDNWQAEHTDNLIDQLFENISTSELSEGLKFSYAKMQPGDIYLVKSFTTKNGAVDNTEHRILLITTVPANKVANQEYLGFAFTSNLDQAMVNNKERNKHVLIKNYDTILESGETSQKSVVINLRDLISFKLADLANGNYSLLGHASDSFMKFVHDIVSNKIAPTTIWDTDIINKYEGQN